MYGQPTNESFSNKLESIEVNVALAGAIQGTSETKFTKNYLWNIWHAGDSSDASTHYIRSKHKYLATPSRNNTIHSYCSRNSEHITIYESRIFNFFSFQWSM